MIFGNNKMTRKLISEKFLRLLGLTAFIATGWGLIISTLIKEESIYKIGLLILFGFFFAVSVSDNFKKLLERED